MTNSADHFRSWYREVPVCPGVVEFFLTFSANDADDSAYAKIGVEIRRRFSGLSEGISVTAFRPEDDRASDGMLRGIAGLAPLAVIWGGGAVGDFSLVATGYRFDSEKTKKARFERFFTSGGFRGTSLRLESSIKTTLDACVFAAGEFVSQAESFYSSVDEVFRIRNLRSADFVRSWNYVDSILSRYADFNRVRSENFAKWGMENGYPAGTGIGCSLSDGAKLFSFAEFHSKGTSGEPKIRRYKTPSQCEAESYGPQFSRAVSVESEGWKRVHVSGTASVGSGGETLNFDDIDRSLAHTMETVRELLSISGADFSHVVRSHAYFKNAEYAERFDIWKTTRSVGDFPCAENVCDVCRDGWLFEFECVAFVPVSTVPFVEFRLPGEPLGNKADNCRTLAESGFSVPASLAVSGAAVRRMSPGSKEAENFLVAFEKAFGDDYASKKYAVRSSSCGEDGVSNSKAGAFRSVMSIPFDLIFPAVATVRKSLDSGIGPADYGILIQEYVPLKTFGVAFTCDPEFVSHAMVAEVSQGAGETLVSGKNLPDRVSFSRNFPVPRSSSKALGVDWETWRKTFGRIESVFGRPQDVEWGIARDGKPVVLQSRPVTTLRGADIRLLRDFDRFEIERPFDVSGYRLVRNELCEPFDQPTEAELSFLRRLYRHPSVVKAYSNWGITYHPGDFLVSVGDKLFIDEAQERRCFEGSRSASAWSRFWTKTKNSWRLGSVGAEVAYGGRRRLERLESEMISALETAADLLESDGGRNGNAHSGEGARPNEDELLTRLYGPVFESNFLAASYRAFSKGKPSSPGVPYVPASRERWAAALSRLKAFPLKGNSLAFSDVSPFFTPLAEKGRFESVRKDADVREGSGWNGTVAELSPVTEFSPEAVLDFLREAGRSVSVACANLLRGVPDAPDVPKRVDSPRCPSELVSPYYAMKKSADIGWSELSAGSAQGEFYLWDGKSRLPSSDLVLFVETLDPSLVDSLKSNVKAVVSRRGGRLSHFAIVARERGLPVFVCSGIKAQAYVAKRVGVNETGISVIE